MRAAVIFILPTLLCLSSCVFYEARPLSAVDSSASFSGRSLSDAGLRAYLDSVKEAGSSWNLDRLSLAAIYFHPDVAVAEAEADGSRAAIRTARQRPNPVFSFKPQWTDFPTALSPWAFNPALAIPIETAHKRQYRTEQAEATARAAEWRVASKAWEVRSGVRAAMLDIFGAGENVRLLRAEVALQGEAVEKLSAQEEAGESSRFEITQTRLLLNRSQLSLHDAERLAATGEARLATAVGVPLEAIQAITVDYGAFSRLPSVSRDECRRFALTRRDDLMALLAEYAAAESALRLEIAKQYPDLTVGPGYDYNFGQNRWQLGLSLEIPLNRNAGQITQAEGARVVAEKKFLALQAQIEGAIDQALAAYRGSVRKVVTAEQLSRNAATAVSASRTMVEGGEVSALELTRTRIEASSAATAELAARLEALAALGAVENAIHGSIR